MGHLQTVLISENHEEPSSEFVARHLDLPYSIRDSWYSLISTYCSKIIGYWWPQIIPQPMSFSASAWEGVPSLPIGEVGLSPDDIYQSLKEFGFKEKRVRSCHKVLMARPTQ